MHPIKLIKKSEFIKFPELWVHNYGEENPQVRPPLGTWDFFDNDSFSLYKTNLKSQPKNWFYRNNSVKYTINSEGYRTIEFSDVDWKNSIVMFGCSHVFGLGVDDLHTIPKFLEDYLNIPVINMGMNGSSVHFSLHNSLMLYKKYGPPKMVIYGWTSLMRYTLYNSNNIGFQTLRYDKPSDHLIYLNMLYIELIRSIWDDICQIYEFSLFDDTSKMINCDYYGTSLDKARDLMHNGPKTNKFIAKKIHDKIS